MRAYDRNTMSKLLVPLCAALAWVGLAFWMAGPGNRHVGAVGWAALGVLALIVLLTWRANQD